MKGWLVLLFTLAASAKGDNVAPVLAQLAYHTPVVLTFAGLKPICTELPDPFGLSAEELVAGLNALRASGKPFNPLVQWYLHDTGVTGKKQVFFVHLGAVARVAATADGQRLLSQAGIDPKLSPEKLAEALFQLSQRPQLKQTPQEFSAMGLFFGIPATQVESYRKSLAEGKAPAKAGKVFDWFSGVQRASPGFVVQPGDSNQAELASLAEKTQAAWEQFFQEVQLRRRDTLLTLATLDEHPFVANLARSLACRKAFESLID
jgi:hypothetical protein